MTRYVCLWSFSFALLALGCRGKYIRAVDGAPIERTPERLERGGYLVNQVMSCGACHTSRTNGHPLLEPERTDAFLGGGNLYTDKTMGTVWVPNLTPDPDTGLGAWKDDEVLRALRDGVAADEHFLLPLMPCSAYRSLSDDDARAVVAYLRSIPPYRQLKPRPVNDLAFMPKVLFKMLGVHMHPPAVGVVAPAKTDPIAYGRYLAHLGACTECHSMAADGVPRPEGDPLFMAGSSVAFEDPELGTTYPRNLTPDPDTGLGNYDANAIKLALRAGRRLDGKRLAPPMALLIPHVSGMVEDDLVALVAFLKSLPATKNRVPDRDLVPPLRQELGD